ncbi:zinc finger C-x8-C-x5-C-x3-H type family protein [Actinidia rufa]|uniref:Zinc finger C-x8-C-x5-C-x3-H type family protein n=1 Tax=Actinidia rufa TaxID=165716 RepID=A0A7J0E2X3_9ERIC|nr:zinc finger C-x8-C-x5-C-x3-H type family protein [Actinidia rufa]
MVNAGSSQPRGATDFGSKQNQFKPFENKWTRFSPINTVGSQASRQPDNLPATANHKCTDPESCKRQIIEDFEQERPLWKLSCYGHGKSSPCDIIGDISYEELRAAAYDDAKRGLSLQSIVRDTAYHISLCNLQNGPYECSCILKIYYLLPNQRRYQVSYANEIKKIGIELWFLVMDEVEPF